MKWFVKLAAMLCLTLSLLSGCVQEVHYDTFEELLACEENFDTSDEKRETQNVILFQNNEYLGFPTFQHLNEYDYLSSNILEFAVGENWNYAGGTWYYPEDRDNFEILIFVSEDGKASIWKCIIAHGEPPLVIETEDGTTIYY